MYLTCIVLYHNVSHRIRMYHIITLGIHGKRDTPHASVIRKDTV